MVRLMEAFVLFRTQSYNLSRKQDMRMPETILHYKEKFLAAECKKHCKLFTTCKKVQKTPISSRVGGLILLAGAVVSIVGREA